LRKRTVPLPVTIEAMDEVSGGCANSQIRGDADCAIRWVCMFRAGGGVVRRTPRSLVAQQSQEIGVRMAWVRVRHIARKIQTYAGCGAVGVGGGQGGVLTWRVMRLVKGLLFALRPEDPVSRLLRQCGVGMTSAVRDTRRRAAPFDRGA